MKKILLFLFFQISFLQSSLPYEIITLTPSVKSMATDINRKGEVCGLIQKSDKNYDIFFYNSSKKVTKLGITTTSTLQPHINSNGDIIGTCENKEWFKNGYTSFIWNKKEGLKKIFHPKWSDTYAQSINDKGEILLTDKAITLLSSDSTKSCLYQNEGDFVDLPTFDQVVKINNSEKIIGKVSNLATILDLSSSVFESILPNKICNLSDINDLGDVVGLYQEDRKIGFQWHPLEGLIKLENFAPIKINNLGEIIGYDVNAIPHLYKNGKFYNLNLLYQSDEWKSVVFINAINDKSQIVGLGNKKDQGEAFLLNPVGKLNIEPLDVTDKMSVACKENFLPLLQNEFVLVEFYAEWCRHCQKIAPLLETFCKSKPENLIIAKLDGEKDPFLVKNYRIKAYPTFILFRNGLEIKRFNSVANLNELNKLLECQECN